MNRLSSSKFGVPNSPGRKSFTPKAFHIVAQGRRAAAHPGLQALKTSTLKGLHNPCTINEHCLENPTFNLWNPFRVLGYRGTITQGGTASPLTLGYDVQPLRGNHLTASLLDRPNLKLLRLSKLTRLRVVLVFGKSSSANALGALSRERVESFLQIAGHGAWLARADGVAVYLDDWYHFGRGAG